LASTYNTSSKGVAKEAPVTNSLGKEPLDGETTLCIVHGSPAENREAFPSPTISIIPSSPYPIVGKVGENETLPSPTLPAINISMVEAGFRELEEKTSSLNTVLESLIPFIKDNDQALKLPTFIGRKRIERGESSGQNTSKIKSTS